MKLNKSLSVKDLALRTLLYFVVTVICIVILYPYFVMFCTALKSRSEIFSMDGTILPVNALWSNFVDIWTLAPMGNYMLNSILIAGGSTLLAMLCGIPAAYALARMKFRGQTAFLGFIEKFDRFMIFGLILEFFILASCSYYIAFTENFCYNLYKRNFIFFLHEKFHKE